MKKMVLLPVIAIIMLLTTACMQKPSAFESAVADVKDGKFDLAFPALQAESEAGNRDAQILLAKLYAAGIGVDKDPAKAEELLACHSTSPCTPGEAEYFVGMDFLDRAGSRSNRAEAIHWFKLSRRLGYAPAEEKLREILVQEN